MTVYDDPVLEAAATRATGDSTGAWLLADALLTAIPQVDPKDLMDTINGLGDTTQTVPDPPVPTRLQEYADRLAEEGIETPGGAPYSASTLADLRGVAMRWPTKDRFAEAAFRTHQEANRRSSDAGKALEALCYYAAGKGDNEPTYDKIDVDPLAWLAATEKVNDLQKRGARYTVSANALRLALRRKVNTPERDEPVVVGEAAEAPAAIGKAEASMTTGQDMERLEAKYSDAPERDPRHAIAEEDDGLDPLTTRRIAIMAGIEEILTHADSGYGWTRAEAVATVRQINRDSEQMLTDDEFDAITEGSR